MGADALAELAIVYGLIIPEPEMPTDEPSKKRAKVADEKEETKDEAPAEQDDEEDDDPNAWWYTETAAIIKRQKLHSRLPSKKRLEVEPRKPACIWPSLRVPRREMVYSKKFSSLNTSPVAFTANASTLVLLKWCHWPISLSPQRKCKAICASC